MVSIKQPETWFSDIQISEYKICLTIPILYFVSFKITLFQRVPDYHIKSKGTTSNIYQLLVGCNL